jgi:hypothetical protein
MTWVIIDLFGDEPEEINPNKKEVQLAPEKEQLDLPLQKQVINIMGEIVTI